MKKIELGIIGCGNMAQAIIKSLMRTPSQTDVLADGIEFSARAFDTDREKLRGMESYGVEVCKGNAELVSMSDIVLLAVKPQSAQTALSGLNFSGKTVISIMAGITLNRLGVLLNHATDKLVRVMPNLNAKVGLSVNAYCSNNLSENEDAVIKKILGSFGECVRVEESMMNSITGISGSGPAFVFEFIDAFIREGIKRGLNSADAKNIALSTILGSVKTVMNYDGKMGDLIDSVCSKGGTTIEGIKYLRTNNFSDTVETAIEKAIKRSEEMEKEI